MKNAHLRSVKHSSLNSATFSLSNKSGDRIILTREKIDLSLRGTKSSDELVDLAMFPTMSNFYRIFIRDNINRMYVRNRNIFIKIFFTLLFLNLFASDKIREKPLRQRFFSFLRWGVFKETDTYLSQGIELCTWFFVVLKQHASPSVYRQLRTANVRTKLEQ